MSEPENNEPAPQTGDSNGGSLLTAVGVGGGILIVLLTMLLRGGTRLATQGLGNNQNQNQVAPEMSAPLNVEFNVDPEKIKQMIEQKTKGTTNTEQPEKQAGEEDQ